MGEQTYTFTMPEADVTIHGVFRTTAARIEVTPAEIDFGTASPGYAQPEAKTVVIRNSGEREKDVTLSTSSSFFNITPVGTWGNFGSSQTIKKVTLSPGAEASFTVQPKTGLPASEYKYTYTANIATNPTVRFQAVFQVQEKYVSGFSVIHQPKLQYTDGETLDLSELQVQITYNNGDTETLSYNAAGLSFSIDGTAVTHNETTVTSSAAGKPITVHYGSFTANTDPLGVTDPRYSITVSPAVLDFGSAQPGYSRPAAQAVTVTNSGNRPVTIQMPSLAGYAIAAGGDWQNGTLPVGGSLTLTIQPNGGLGVGTYDKTLTITGENGASAAVRLQFSVHAASDPGGGESDPYLRFDSNGGTDFAPIDGHGSSFSINPYEDEDYGTHIPSRPGYRFTGWYRDSRLARRVDEGETLRVTGSMTLFAGWEEMTVPALLNGDDHYAYIQGYADGTVRPNASITRAQVATIFFRLLDEDVREEYLTTSNRFPDVDEDYWANTAISTMAALGVINGRNNGTFDPGAYITRAEFAAICSRLDDSGVTGVSTLTDISGHWAEEEIRRAAALGWIHGFSDGTFRPDESITRAQAVTMINRVLCRQPEEADDLLPGMNTWTDCRADDWFYLAIQEAGNSHDYRPKDETYESWTALHDTPDWSRYE